MIGFTALYLVTHDDFCLAESCNMLLEQNVKRFMFCVPRAYWNGTLVSLKEEQEIKGIVAKLERQGAKVRIIRPPSISKGLYAEKETKSRNLALREIDRWTRSHNHVIILDGDELMKPGSINILENSWYDHQQRATTMKSLDIVGFPGYPVNSVKEGLLVHVWTKYAEFSYARCVNTVAHPLDHSGVIHFTSTRRTREESIAKHLQSSHYDDIDNYDFDGWLKNKFPKLVPGERDCHMFKHYQIWDSVRNFTEAEWRSIPDRLKQYLGAPE